MNGNRISLISRRNGLAPILLLLCVFGTVSLTGCQSPFVKWWRDYTSGEHDPPSINANARPHNPWDKAAGLDPNARSIERNLGYE